MLDSQIGATTFLQALPRNSEQTHFIARNPQRTVPNGAHDLLGDDIRIGMGIIDPSAILIQPFGTTEPQLSFLMRIWGWSAVASRKLYIPLLLSEVSVVLGKVECLDKNTWMADMISLRDGGSSNVEVYSRGSGIPAHLKVSPLGSRYIEFDWGRNCSPPAHSANAFFKPLL